MFFEFAAVTKNDEFLTLLYHYTLGLYQQHFGNISVLKCDAEKGDTGIKLATEAEHELFFLTHREKVRFP
jgi:hypothetical protein